eukprot:Phypoly_transcript_16870.p1 GENE.Phypoly_transcript_16870~~Phypoly_transcript_16870.p1  ORF type:complete len:217 (+),score=32.90 Phypoly_transcript_16870:101-751(+)
MTSLGNLRGKLGVLVGLCGAQVVLWFGIIWWQMNSGSQFAPWLIPMYVLMVLEIVQLFSFIGHLTSAAPIIGSVRIFLFYAFTLLSSVHIVVPCAWAAWAVGRIRCYEVDDACNDKEIVSFLPTLLSIMPLVVLGYRIHILIEFKIYQVAYSPLTDSPALLHPPTFPPSFILPSHPPPSSYPPSYPPPSYPDSHPPSYPLSSHPPSYPPSYSASHN